MTTPYSGAEVEKSDFFQIFRCNRQMPVQIDPKASIAVVEYSRLTEKKSNFLASRLRIIVG